MATFYFDLHVFYSRNNGYSVPVKMEKEYKPSEEQIIQYAIDNKLIDSEDAQQIDYVDDIDEETYKEMKI